MTTTSSVAPDAVAGNLARLTGTLVPLRPLLADDRARIESMTVSTGVFRPSEVAIAMEVVDAALGIGRRRDPDYETLGAELDGELAGWICWGPTPGTLGTFDLYWVVVDPACQGHGVGTSLVDEMERRLEGRARMIVVETAGRADYALTRRFYDRRGYRVAGRIGDYYAPGDDLVTYVKRLGRAGTAPREEPLPLRVGSP